jgi:hypothetical protein
MPDLAEKNAKELAAIVAHFVTPEPIEAADIEGIHVRQPSPEGKVYRFVHNGIRYYVLDNWSIAGGYPDDKESTQTDRDTIERELRDVDHTLKGGLCKPISTNAKEGYSLLGWQGHYLWNAGHHG